MAAGNFYNLWNYFPKGKVMELVHVTSGPGPRARLMSVWISLNMNRRSLDQRPRRMRAKGCPMFYSWP
jgi:hypothetical protein